MGWFDFLNTEAYKKVQSIVVDWQTQVNELSVILQLSYPPAPHVGGPIQYRNRLLSALIFTAVTKCNGNEKFINLLIKNIEDDEKANVYQGEVMAGVSSLMKLARTIMTDETPENYERSHEVMVRLNCSSEEALLWRVYRTLMMAITEVEDVDRAADMIRDRFVYPIN